MTVVCVKCTRKFLSHGHNIMKTAPILIAIGSPLYTETSGFTTAGLEYGFTTCSKLTSVTTMLDHCYVNQCICTPGSTIIVLHIVSEDYEHLGGCNPRAPPPDLCPCIMAPL